MPRYNYTDLAPKQLREYARDLDRTARRIADIAKWMDSDNVKQITSHNSTIGIRGLDHAQRYANAIEEAVTKYKHDNSHYKPTEKRGRK